MDRSLPLNIRTEVRDQEARLHCVKEINWESQRQLTELLFMMEGALRRNEVIIIRKG